MSFTMVSPYAKKHRARWVLVWLGVLVLVIGGCVVGKQVQLRHEMIQIAHSEQARKEIEAGLKLEDPHAFTSQGVIHSYEVDDSSLEHNPMGGINGYLIINGDRKPDHRANLNLDRFYVDGKLGSLRVMVDDDPWLDTQIFKKYGLNTPKSTLQWVCTMIGDYGPGWIEEVESGRLGRMESDGEGGQRSVDDTLTGREMRRRFGSDWATRKMSPQKEAEVDDALRKLRQQADERYRRACKILGIQPENEDE